MSEPLAQAYLGFPPDILDGLGSVLQAQLEMAADLGWITIRPGPLNEGSAGERVPGFGDGPLAAVFATGVLSGRKAEIAHELSGVLKTGQIPEFSDEGDGHRELDTAHGLKSLDDGARRQVWTCSRSSASRRWSRS